jgi:hypothetical protein
MIPDAAHSNEIILSVRQLAQSYTIQLLVMLQCLRFRLRCIQSVWYEPNFADFDAATPIPVCGPLPDAAEFCHAYQIRQAVCLHLVHDPGSMHLDRTVTDLQFFRQVPV